MPDEQGNNIADFLARHLVTLVGMNVRHDAAGNFLGVETIHGSSFVLVYRHLWFLLTAGHIVSALDEALKKPHSRLYVTLIDSVHYNAKHKNSLWLPYENLTRASVGNGDDIDYGVIVPDTITRANLEANNIVPVASSNWESPPESFDRYFLVGTPAELINVRLTHLPPSVTGLRAAMLEVIPEENPPELLRKTFPRFYGRIDLSVIEHGDEPGIKDIGGMSGCPLLGMSLINGTAKYWFYGIQSGWDKTSTIAACPFRPFAQHLQETLDKILDTED